MSKYFVTFLFLGISFSAFCQKYNPNINKLVNSSDQSVERIRNFEQFGLKTPGSDQINQTKSWLINQYSSYGYTNILIDSFEKNNRTYNNIVVTKQGQSNEYIIVCGHYDTRGGVGANDNGSGVAAILETARLIADLTTIRTIKFINFDGEEEGYTGSQYYVNQTLNNQDSLLYLVLNIDQIGGTKGESGNDKIICERDENNSPMSNNGRSWLITDTIAQLARLYTSLEPQIGIVTGSDYVPFENQGYTVTGLYQYANDRFGHSAADSLGNMDTVSFKEAVKLSISSAVHFAQIPKYSGINELLQTQSSIFPNPANRHIQTNEFQPDELEIWTTSGQLVYQLKNIESKTIKLPEILNDMYIVKLKKDSAVSIQKLQIAQW